MEKTLDHRPLDPELEAIIERTVYHTLQKYRPPVPLNSVSDDIDIVEVCRLAGDRPKSWVYFQTSQGDMPHKRRGKFLIFSRKEILAWLDEKTVRKVSPAEQAEARVIEEATKKLTR